VRGVRLDGDDPVQFEPPHVTEMRIPPETDAWTPGSDWPNWPSYTLVRVAGCYAWQIDGLDFSYTVVFLAHAGSD
jgi:hypothetical protein